MAGPRINVNTIDECDPSGTDGFHDLDMHRDTSD